MQNFNYKDPTFRIEDSIKGMSYENLVKFAKEEPIIPLDDYKKTMSDTVGYASDIQAYGTLINSQPDIQLKEVDNIIPSQEKARENVDVWFDELNPKIIANSTGVIQYCNFYGSLTDNDIEQLVNNINTTGGKEDFILVMKEFEAQTQKNIRQVTATSSDLVDFNSALAGDLRNFQSIKNSADALYLGEDGRLQGLQDDMVRYNAIIDECNVAIAAASTFVGLGILAIGVGVLLVLIPGVGNVLGGALIAGGILVTGVSGGVLGVYIEQKAEAQASYQKTAVEFATAQAQCGILQTVSDTFVSLGEANSKASGVILKMINAWQTMGEQFSGLAKTAQEVVDQNTQILIKLKLKGALEDVRDLNLFAKTCQANGILPVVPDEKMITNLHLPRSWKDQRIEGDVFREFVWGMRKKGYFDRGRNGWRTRSPCLFHLTRSWLKTRNI